MTHSVRTLDAQVVVLIVVLKNVILGVIMPNVVVLSALRPKLDSFYIQNLPQV
jgi:hypothetical protein